MMKPANPVGKANPVSTHKLSLYVPNPEQVPRINRTKPVTIPVQTPVYPSELERERYSPSARLQEAVEILGSIAGVRSVGCNNAGVVRHCASIVGLCTHIHIRICIVLQCIVIDHRRLLRVQSSPAQVTSLSLWATREPAELQSHHLNPSSVQYLPNSPRFYPASKSSPSNLIDPQFSGPSAVEYNCMHRAASPRAHPNAGTDKTDIFECGGGGGRGCGYSALINFNACIDNVAGMKPANSGTTILVPLPSSLRPR
ncbi:hypothetical protein D9757_010238 [Collybiopsis confluens]|uniref:Uncharacterized protein n=1 Tax=Collybiopsis confluens TaxID=2823264 RepID=A0A8H5HAX6_9AGAR|nr:hypothetical protein D9757_010238 [Collybiopsis confluens]